MGDGTSIAWCDASWNYIRGCSMVSAGCTNCYAMGVAHRFSGPGLPYEGLTRETGGRPVWNGKVIEVPERLADPLRWKRPRRVFVNSMSDVFHESLSDEAIARVWQQMCLAHHHSFQLLTKRPARMREWVSRWYSGGIAEPMQIAPAPGFPGYRVTSHGAVLGKRSDTATGLALDSGPSGHLRVRLYKDGSPPGGDRALVHRLVLEAFTSRTGQQVRHLNGNPSDNRLSNLRWGTQADNWKDRVAHGAGRSHAKLSPEDVASIRERARSGESSAGIARDFSVSDTQVRNIVNGRQWAGRDGAGRPEPGHRAVLDCVWLGVSVEDERVADRIDILRQVPSAVRFLSIEPMIGPVDIRGKLAGIDWVICGGESGPGARECREEWIDDVVDECRAAGVPCFVKQTGSVLARAWGLKHKAGADPGEWPVYPGRWPQAFPHERQPETRT